jgi:hypothetical protein
LAFFTAGPSIESSPSIDIDLDRAFEIGDPSVEAEWFVEGDVEDGVKAGVLDNFRFDPGGASFPVAVVIDPDMSAPEVPAVVTFWPLARGLG